MPLLRRLRDRFSRGCSVPSQPETNPRRVIRQDGRGPAKADKQVPRLRSDRASWPRHHRKRFLLLLVFS